jgi:hypothetical protein
MHIVANAREFLHRAEQYECDRYRLYDRGNIQVKFIWLTFPIVLYIVITAFFIATVIQIRDLLPWDYFTLALSWCKEQGDNHLPGPKQMEARRKRVKVHLQDEGTSWHVRERSAPSQWQLAILLCTRADAAAATSRSLSQAYEGEGMTQALTSGPQSAHEHSA